jgi:hypothetical protein
MTTAFLSESIAILKRTTKVLNDLLRNLPEPWVQSKDDPEHWSPFDCIGHLIHGEKTDWMSRVNVILKHGPAVTFTPFNRFAQLRDSQGKTIVDSLYEFADLHAKDAGDLRGLRLTGSQLDRRSTPRDVRPHTQSTGRTNGRDVRSIPNSSTKLSWR